MLFSLFKNTVLSYLLNKPIFSEWKEQENYPGHFSQALRRQWCQERLILQISMTGKGRCNDNIYIERFWRSLKREEFYLKEYENVRALKKSIAAYIEFYNRKRFHQSLNYKTSDRCAF